MDHLDAESLRMLKRQPDTEDLQHIHAYAKKKKKTVAKLLLDR